jgi:hypothetical protein
MLSIAARLRQREGVDSLGDSKTVSSDDRAKRHFGQRVPLSISARRAKNAFDENFATAINWATARPDPLNCWCSQWVGIAANECSEAAGFAGGTRSFFAGSNHGLKLLESRIPSSIKLIYLCLNIGWYLLICDNVTQMCEPPSNFGGYLGVHPNAQEPIGIGIMVAPVWLPNLSFFMSEPRFKLVPISNQFSRFC